MKDGNPTLVGTGEAARELGVARNALTRWVAEGRVAPTFRTAGGHLRWDVGDLRSQLDALTAGQQPEQRGDAH